MQAEGVVFKIVPMEGCTPVNGEQQKCAGDILAEVDISLRLSRLRGEPGALCNPYMLLTGQAQQRLLCDMSSVPCISGRPQPEMSAVDHCSDGHRWQPWCS